MSLDSGCVQACVYVWDIYTGEECPTGMINETHVGSGYSNNSTPSDNRARCDELITCLYDVISVRYMRSLLSGLHLGGAGVGIRPPPPPLGNFVPPLGNLALKMPSNIFRCAFAPPWGFS